MLKKIFCIALLCAVCLVTAASAGDIENAKAALQANLNALLADDAAGMQKHRSEAYKAFLAQNATALSITESYEKGHIPENEYKLALAMLKCSSYEIIGMEKKDDKIIAIVKYTVPDMDKLMTKAEASDKAQEASQLSRPAQYFAAIIAVGTEKLENGDYETITQEDRVPLVYENGAWKVDLKPEN